MMDEQTDTDRTALNELDIQQAALMDWHRHNPGITGGGAEIAHSVAAAMWRAGRDWARTQTAQAAPADDVRQADGSEIEGIEHYRRMHADCDIQQHPWQAVFGAGFGAGHRAARSAALDTSEQRNARLEAALNGWRHKRTADDGLPCWCLTEHAHRKYGCDDLRAVLAEPRGEGIGE